MKHLNAAHGSYFLSRTFAHLVCFFRPPKPDRPDLKLDKEKVLEGQEQVRRVEPYVHDLLRDLLRYVLLRHFVCSRLTGSIPGAVFKLSSELTSRYPHCLEDVSQHEPYTRNLLIIMKNNPILTEHIMGLLIDRFLQIDIAIPLEDAQLNEFDPDLNGDEKEGVP